MEDAADLTLAQLDAELSTICTADLLHADARSGLWAWTDSAQLRRELALWRGLHLRRTHDGQLVARAPGC